MRRLFDTSAVCQGADRGLAVSASRRPVCRPVHEAAQGPWPLPCPDGPGAAVSAAQAALAAGPAPPPRAGFVVLQYAGWHPGEHIDAPVALPTGYAPAGAAGAAGLIAYTEHLLSGLQRRRSCHTAAAQQRP